MKLVLLFFPRYTPFKRPPCPQPGGLDVHVVYHPRALPCPALDQQCPVSFPGTKGAWIKIDASEMLKIVSLSTQLARQWQNTRDRSGEEGGIRGASGVKGCRLRRGCLCLQQQLLGLGDQVSQSYKNKKWMAVRLDPHPHSENQTDSL